MKSSFSKCGLFSLALGALLLTGCYTGSVVRNRVWPNMTAEQVTARCGKPKKITQDGPVEIWAYEWNSPYDAKIGGMWDYVYLQDKRVVGADADSEDAARQAHEATWGALQRSIEHQQEIEAYNARTRALAQPVQVDVNVSGKLDHYHYFNFPARVR